MNELSLAAGTLPEFAPETVAESAAQAGFSSVGLMIDPQTWSPAAMRRVQRALRSGGLAVLDVEVVWIPAGGRLGDAHRLIVDAAAELEARNLLVVSAEPDPLRTADALHQLCERAAPAGIRIALEFLMITAVRTLPEALQVIRACDHPAAALLVDALHLERAGHHPHELRPVAEELLPYAQLCDGRRHCDASHSAYLEDAVDLRSAPGEGELPLAELLESLPPACPLSLEVRSRRYRNAFPDPVERAARIRERTLRFLESLVLPASGRA